MAEEKTKNTIQISLNFNLGEVVGKVKDGERVITNALDNISLQADHTGARIREALGFDMGPALARLREVAEQAQRVGAQVRAAAGSTSSTGYASGASAGSTAIARGSADSDRQLMERMREAARARIQGLEAKIQAVYRRMEKTMETAAEIDGLQNQLREAQAEFRRHFAAFKKSGNSATGSSDDDPARAGAAAAHLDALRRATVSLVSQADSSANMAEASGRLTAAIERAIIRINSVDSPAGASVGAHAGTIKPGGGSPNGPAGFIVVTPQGVSGAAGVKFAPGFASAVLGKSGSSGSVGQGQLGFAPTPVPQTHADVASTRAIYTGLVESIKQLKTVKDWNRFTSQHPEKQIRQDLGENGARVIGEILARRVDKIFDRMMGFVDEPRSRGGRQASAPAHSVAGITSRLAELGSRDALQTYFKQLNPAHIKAMGAAAMHAIEAAFSERMRQIVDAEEADLAARARAENLRKASGAAAPDASAAKGPVARTPFLATLPDEGLLAPIGKNLRAVIDRLKREYGNVDTKSVPASNPSGALARIFGSQHLNDSKLVNHFQVIFGADRAGNDKVKEAFKSVVRQINQAILADLQQKQETVAEAAGPKGAGGGGGGRLLLGPGRAPLQLGAGAGVAGLLGPGVYTTPGGTVSRGNVLPGQSGPFNLGPSTIHGGLYQINPYTGRRVSAPAPASGPVDMFGNPIGPAMPDGAGAPGWVGRVPVSQLNTLPSVFQYKAGVEDKFGGTGSLASVEKWNSDLEGITLVWRRISDGLDYIINGHNRFSLAQRVGQPDLPVKYIDARDDEEARAIGALVNIGEGNGTAVDAAKVFKKYGYTEHDLRAKGVPIAKDVARQGLGLAQLNDQIFEMVENEELTPGRGAIIGSRLPSHDLQSQLLKLIQKRGTQRLTDGMVAELADMVAGAPKQTVEQQDLFGSFMKEESAVFERADLLAYVRSKLTQDKNVFGGAARNKSKLEAGGNVIDAENSSAIAEAAARNLAVFDTLKNRSGEIARIIDDMALELKNAKGKKERDAVLAQTYERVSKAFDVVLAGGEGTGPGAGGGDSSGSRALVHVGPSPNAAADETETERRQREEIEARMRAADFEKQRAAADARSRRESEIAARVAAERQRLMTPLGTFNMPGTVEAVLSQTAAQPPPGPSGPLLLGANPRVEAALRRIGVVGGASGPFNLGGQVESGFQLVGQGRTVSEGDFIKAAISGMPVARQYLADATRAQRAYGRGDMDSAARYAGRLPELDDIQSDLVNRLLMRRVTGQYGREREREYASDRAVASEHSAFEGTGFLSEAQRSLRLATSSRINARVQARDESVLQAALEAMEGRAPSRSLLGGAPPPPPPPRGPGDYEPFGGDPRDPNKLRRRDGQLFGEHVPYEDPISSLFPTNVADELGALRRIQQLVAEGRNLEDVVADVAQVFERMGEKGDRTAAEITEGMRRVQSALGGVGTVADHSSKSVATLESEISALQKGRADRTAQLALDKGRFAELDRVRQNLNINALDHQVAYRSAEADHYAKQQEASRLRDVEIDFKRIAEEDRRYNAENELKGDEARKTPVSYTGRDGTFHEGSVRDVLKQVGLDKEQAGADITTASLRMKELATAEKEAMQQAVLLKPAIDSLRASIVEQERANTRDVLAERQLTLALKERKEAAKTTAEADAQRTRDRERVAAAGRTTRGAGAPDVAGRDLAGARAVHLATGSYGVPSNLDPAAHADFADTISQAATRDYPAVSSALTRAADAMDRLRRSNKGYVADLDEVVDEASEFGSRTSQQWRLLVEGTNKGKQALADLRAEIALDAEAAKKAQNELKDLVETRRQLLENTSNRQDALSAVKSQARTEVETLRGLRSTRSNLGEQRRRAAADGQDTTALDERYAAAGREVQASRDRLSALNSVKRDLSSTDEISSRSGERLNEVITQSKVKAEGAKRALDEKRHTAQQLGAQLRATSGDLGEFGNELFANVLSANVLANAITNLAHRVKSGIAETILYAARTEELQIALAAAAKATNTPITSIQAVEQSVKKLNITTQETSETILKFMQAGLDVGKVGKLASVAQDLAVVAGVNTAEEIDRLTHGIVTLQPRVLRTAGVFITVREVMSDLAAETGRTMTSFSELEKQQATLSAVLEKGARVTGLYDSAMNSASKQMRSLDREFKEAQNALGDVFIPLLYAGVNALRWLLQYIQFAPASFLLLTGAITTAVVALGLMSSALTGGAIMTGLTTLWTTLKLVAGAMIQVGRAGGFAAAGLKGLDLAAASSGFGALALAAGALLAGLIYLAGGFGEVADANDRILSQAALKIQVYQKDLLFLKQNADALKANGAATEQFNAIRDQQMAADANHIKQLQMAADVEMDAAKRVDLRAQAIGYLNEKLQESIELEEANRRQQLQQSVAKTLSVEEDADDIVWGLRVSGNAWSSAEFLDRRQKQYQEKNKELRREREEMQRLTQQSLGRAYSPDEFDQYYNVTKRKDGDIHVSLTERGKKLGASEDDLKRIIEVNERILKLRAEMRTFNNDIATLREDSEEAEKSRMVTAKRFATDYADTEEAKLKLYRREFPKATEDEVRKKLDEIRRETAHLREQDFEIYNADDRNIQRIQRLIDKELELRRLQGERLAGTAAAINEINDAVEKIKLPDFDVQASAQGAAALLGGVEDKVRQAVKGYTGDVKGFAISEDEGGMAGQNFNAFTGREELALAINRLKGDPAGFKALTGADNQKTLAQQLAAGLSDTDVKRFIAGVSTPLLTAAQEQGRDVAKALLGADASENEIKALGQQIVRNISPATAELIDFAKMNGDAASRAAELAKKVKDAADAIRDFTLATAEERGLEAELQLLTQAEGKIKEISSLRIELGLPDERAMPTSLRALNLEIAQLSRLKSAKDDIFKLSQAQAEAEMKVVVSRRAAVEGIVDAETRAAQSYFDNLREKREGEEQLTADIMVELKKREEARRGGTGDLRRAQLQAFSDTLKVESDASAEYLKQTAREQALFHREDLEKSEHIRKAVEGSEKFLPTIEGRIQETNRILSAEIGTKLDQLIANSATPKVMAGGSGLTSVPGGLSYQTGKGVTAADVEAARVAANKYGGLYGVDPALLMRVAEKESTFNRFAVSPVGAKGMMQFMPATGDRFGLKTEADFYDVDKSMSAGAQYLRKLLDMFGGRVDLALAGYNAGEGAVMKYGNKIPPYRETQDYVAKILPKYQADVAAHGTPEAKERARVAALAEQWREKYRTGGDAAFGSGPGVISEEDAKKVKEYLDTESAREKSRADGEARARSLAAVEDRRAKAAAARALKQKAAQEAKDRAAELAQYRTDESAYGLFPGALTGDDSAYYKGAVASRKGSASDAYEASKKERAQLMVDRARLGDITREELLRGDQERQRKLYVTRPVESAKADETLNALLGRDRRRVGTGMVIESDRAARIRAEAAAEDEDSRKQTRIASVKEFNALSRREAAGYLDSEEFKTDAVRDAEVERMRARESTHKELVQLTDAEARGVLDSEATKRHAVESSQAAFKRAYADTHKELHALRAEDASGFYASEAFKTAAVEEQEAARRRSRRDTAKQVLQAQADEASGYLQSAEFARDAWEQAYLQRRQDAETLARSVISLEDKLAHAGEDAAMRYRKAWLEAKNDIKDRDVQAVESQIRSAEELKDANVVHSEQVREKVLAHLAQQKTATQAYADSIITIYEGIAGGWDKAVDKMTSRLGFFGTAIGEILKQKGRSILTGIFTDVLGLPDIANIVAPQTPEEKMATAADKLLESSKRLDEAANALNALGGGAAGGGAVAGPTGLGRVISAYRGARSASGGFSPWSFIKGLFGGGASATSATTTSTSSGGASMGVDARLAGDAGGGFSFGGLSPFLLSGTGGGNSGASASPIFGSGSAAKFAANFFGGGYGQTVTEANDAAVPGTAPGSGSIRTVTGAATSGAGGGLRSIFQGGKVNFGNIGPAIAPMLPMLGMSLGSGLGGQSMLGRIMGSAGGLLAGGIGAAFLAPGLVSAFFGGGASAAATGGVFTGSLFGGVGSAGGGLAGSIVPLLTNPITAIVAGALLVGAYFLGRNAQRKKDEKIRNQASHDLGSGVWKLIDDVNKDRIDGASALAQAGELEAAYRQNISQIKDKKTKRHAELWLANDYPAVRKKLEQAVDAQMRREAINRQLVPEFASGGAVNTSLIMVKPGEVVLSPADVSALGGPGVMAAAGVPGFGRGARARGASGGHGRGFRGMVPGVDRGVDDTLLRATPGSAVLNRSQQKRLAGMFSKFAGGGAVYDMMGGSGAYGLTSIIPAFQFGGFVPFRDGSHAINYATGGEVPAPAPIAPIAPLSATANSSSAQSGGSDQTIHLDLNVELSVGEEAATGIVVKGLKSSTGQRVLLGTIRNLKRNGEIK